MKYYHFCTEGLKRGLIFRDEEDFIVAMNYVAITARENGIMILAFCLMSNHWHFVVKGNVHDISRFNTMLKRRVSMWLHRKYDVSHYLKGQEVMIKEVESMEYLKSVIGYVLRNPIVAGINCTIESYRWGSGSCYFQGKEKRNGTDDAGTMDKELEMDRPDRRMARMIAMASKEKGEGLSPFTTGILCRSRSEAMKGFHLDKSGMITPDQFVDASSVMNIFKTAKSFIYNVMSFKSSDIDMELESGLAQKITIEDSKLVRIVENICTKDFHVRSADMLPTREKCKLAIMLRKQFSAGNKQISRIIGLDQDVVDLLR